MLIATCLIFKDFLEKAVQILLSHFFLAAVFGPGGTDFLKPPKLAFVGGRNRARILNTRFFMNFILGSIFDLKFIKRFFYFHQMCICPCLRPNCTLTIFNCFKLENRMNICHCFMIKFIFIKYLTVTHLILYHIEILLLY